MKKLFPIGLFILWIFSCQSQNPGETVVDEVHSLTILVGAERSQEYLPLLRGKRVGLVVNQTSRIGETHLVDSLISLGIEISKVFAPEHGFRGDHSDGAHIENSKDKKTGLPIISLYGSQKKPTAEMLKDVDVLVFDIQDVGVRFYTFISTMHYVMEACAENQKLLLVLDRPNPNGFYVDGPVLEPAYQSFIGMHPIPIVHGLTVGELARMINGEKWLKGGLQCELKVVQCENYDHSLKYELPVPPSPNLPNMNAVYLYPFLGLFEGTNVSVGRGTQYPFQIIGRPGFDGEMEFTPQSIPGVSDHPKYESVLCSGIMIKDVVKGDHFFDPGLNLNYLLKFYESNRREDGPFFRDFFLKLSGTASLKTQIEEGWTAEKIKASWAIELEQYKLMRKKYLLYL